MNCYLNLQYTLSIIYRSKFNTAEICYERLCTSSKLKSTPPMGAPKATLTPAADAADKI